MKRILLFVLICSLSKAYAQKDSLSLEDAILSRWTKFAPDRISGLQWVKNSNNICYTKESQMVIENIEGDQNTIPLSKINKHFNEDSLGKFPTIHWLDQDRFRFQKNSTFHIYDLSKDYLTNLLSFDKNAHHTEFSNKALALAYTLENNLLIQDSNNKTHRITSDESSDIVNGQAVHRYEFGISKGTFWSNSGKYIAFYRKDESMVTAYPLVNTSGRIATIDNVKYPMAGMESHHVTLGVYNLKNEKTIFLKTGEPKDQYLTNIAWGPKDEYIYIAILNRDQNHMKLNKYDAKSGKYVKTLFEEKHEKYTQPLHPMIFIPGHDNEFLWRSERDGFDHFYRYNTEGQLLNQVTNGEWVVKDFIAFSDQSILFTGTHNHALETQVFKSSLNSSRSTRISKAKGVHRIQASSNGQYLIDLHSSLENPRTIELIDYNGKSIRTLLQSEDPFENIEIAQTELYTIKTKGATALNCRMIKPADFDTAKTYPALVYVYNGPGVQLLHNSHLAAAPLWMHYLANEKNYIVFTVDGRGSENRGRDFEQEIFRNLGEVEMQDQIRGVEHLKSLKFIDGNRIAVHGWSYGGFMTTNLMCTYPNVFTCGVAGGPVTDWKLYEVMYTERFMDTPQTNPKGYESTNLINKAENLKGDLLMIHGAQDDVVVWQHSLAFVQQCVEKDVQLDYFTYPHHPHNVRGKDRVHLMRKVIDYIIDHNQ